jgi:hypothetical protein
VAHLQEEVAARWSEHIRTDPARQMVFAKQPLQEDLESSMNDPWADAQLEEVLLFVRRRIIASQWQCEAKDVARLCQFGCLVAFAMLGDGR